MAWDGPHTPYQRIQNQRSGVSAVIHVATSYMCVPVDESKPGGVDQKDASRLGNHQTRVLSAGQLLDGKYCVGETPNRAHRMGQLLWESPDRE
mmetsp:Transcript_152532/g.370232  ORF Transcript_152532/g.370232 Transcript_152532/m.370232 type:complete len:93 (+) Transcript_152532:116-394(+)